MRLPVLLAAVAVATQPSLALAADPAEARLATRAADVVAVMRGEKTAGEVFTTAFNAAVSTEQFATITGQLAAQNGKLIGAEDVRSLGNGAASFSLRYERARATALLQLDGAAPHKVAGFRITGVTPLDDGPQKIVEDFAALPGKSGFALVKLAAAGPETVLAHNPAEQFAIGSAFKLWVLDALAEEVAAGRLKWDQVVRLGTRSLPSGMMQDWPDDAPVTVETLATLMISISDNTATDTLIRLIGRDRIAARVRATGHSEPDRMLPFLTTLEAFALKAGDEARRNGYSGADEAGQARLLSQLDRGLSPEKLDGRALGGGKPIAIDKIEWFASAQDMAGVLDSLRKRSDPRIRSILAVKPSLGPELRAAFPYAGFKGGSEPGVINLSWLLRNKAGDWYALSASWNDVAAPVDNKRFELLAMRLVALAK